MLVPRLGGPDEVVVRDLEQLPGLLEPSGHLVDPLLRIPLLALGLLLHALSVLVHSDHEPHFVAAQSPVSRDRVCADLLERVTHVRVTVGVIDRRRQVDNVTIRPSA